jgi:uroporphyrinogen-III synthase
LPDEHVRLLVTRPEPECERTAALLRSRGHEVLALPLLRIEGIADAEIGTSPWAAVVFTSVNAIRAIAAHRRFGELVGLPAFVVGQRSRAAAVAAGFSPVASADGDVEDLVRLIASKPPVARLPLLYCAGEERAGDLAGALHAQGLRIDTVVVYRSVMATNLTPDARAALAAGKVDAALHYSARTAEAFVAAITMADIRDLSIRIRHLCLSAQVAAPLAAAGARVVEIADEPNEQALLGLIGRA